MNIKNTLSTGVVILGTCFPYLAHAEYKHTNVGTSISNIASDIGRTLVDSATTAKVKTLLAMEADIPLNISVTTQNDIVYLEGKVATRLQANKMIRIAQSVDNVVDVDVANLSIESSDDFFKDTILTSRVNGKIMQLESSSKISHNYILHTETVNSEVHIWGKVANVDDRQTIEAAIKSMSGVKSLSTNIDVDK